MFKNVASQKIVFVAWDSATGLLKTGDAANLTAYVSKDGGAVTVLADTSATEMDATNAKGCYSFDVAQGESNGNMLLFTCKSSTSGIQLDPVLAFTTPANFTALVIDSSGLADANMVKSGPTGAGTAQTARDLGANIDAAVSSRMATYTQPTGFLAATFPSGTVANTTNITAGIITTVTNLTNAPTAGDLTATMKTSVTTAATAATPTIGGISAGALADLFDTDSGTTYGAAVAGSLVKEIADNAGGSGLTAGDVADAVWDEVLSGHLTAGSTGNALNAAGSAGDPWATALPGAYGAGTAGKLIGDNINAPIATVDTVVDAIKAKTDLLPNATAGAAGGVFIAGANAATSIATALTANITGNVSGSVGSVAANGITATSIATDAINAASVKADAVTKVQTGLATPTNITAGTISTVTNLTNAPTSGDLTAAMKASVTTAATAATPVAASVAGAVGSVISAVTVTSSIKQNQALANFEFLMTDSTTHAPATGKTVTCTRSVDGGSFGTGTLANITEVANGIYRVDFGAGDLNGKVITLRAIATGCDDTFERIVTQP